MKFHRNTVWLVPLFFIVTFPLWSIPVGNFLTPRGGFNTVPKNGQADSHNFNMDTVKILQNQRGRKTVVIRAGKAHTGDDPDFLIMSDVNADLFDDEDNITNIVAKTGQYNMKTKVLTLIGDVVVNKTKERQFLYTDLLLYDSNRRTVNCPGKTRLTGDKVEIDGGSLEYDIADKRYVIDKRVKCTINGFIEP